MTKVSLYIYDISKGMARQLSLPLVGKQIDGVWHTSIVCFDKEYFYGGQGITHCTPCGTVLGAPDETVNLGETAITKKLFKDYLAGLGTETFRPEKYHLFHHNCNTFSNEVAQFLTGKKIPSYITDLPQEVMSTPFGAMIAQFFESVQVQPEVYHPGQGVSSYSGKENHSDSIDSTTQQPDVSLIPAICKVKDDELTKCINQLKQNFEKYAKNLDKLRCVLEEVEFDFGNEDDLRKDITESLGCMCKELQSVNGNVEAFKSLLTVLKATALHLPKVFKYAEGDEIILTVINKLQRGHVNEIKLLRVEFLTNLLSVYELRNHLLAIETMLRTLVTITISSILDGPGPLIREAGCCLAYSLSVVNINDDHTFELSSALLHIISDLEKNTKAREYGMAALKNFTSKSDQVAELARMIVPELCDGELKL